MNLVQNVNVVHLVSVPDQRRDRRQHQRRELLLAAARRVLDRDGLDGLTIKAVADECDTSVGTIYNSFPSKAALVAALQAHAVDALRASFTNAQPTWTAYLDDEALEDDLRALVPLCAFGGFWAAASVVLADEFSLQRALLGARVDLRSKDEVRDALTVAHRLLEQPRALLDRAVELELLEPHDNLERALVWVAALNGVLLLEHLSPVDRHLFRASHLATSLTLDLLTGWGADRADVEVAASHVPRLAALGPLAPRPDGPGYRGPGE